MLNRNKLSCAVAASFLIFSGAGSAITTIESNAGVQFNFNNPGARSLAMGGAFLAMADDATAAYSNPAGLSILRRPEVSFEYRSTDYTTTFADSGRLIGAPSGMGLDTANGIVASNVSESVDSASFMSFVLPRENFTIGFYRHQIADFEAEYQSQGPIVQDRGITAAGTPFISRANPADNDVELDIENWGLSASFRLSDKLSIGGGISYYDFQFEALTNRYSVPADRTGAADFSGNPVSFNTQNGNDEDIGFNLGLLWNFADQWSLGATFRQGAEFKYDYGVSNSTGSFTFDAETEFSMPDTFGIGLAFRPSDQLTISFDYNRITYSDLTSDVVLQGTGEAFNDLDVDDGNEFRLGAEFVFATRYPVALRAGVWQEPDHQISFDGEVIAATTDLPPDELFDRNTTNTRAAFFIPGDDEFHYSFGAGIAFDRFQIDAAADFSDRVDTISISGVIRF